MKKQELCKALLNIDYDAAEKDDPTINEHITCLIEEVEKLPKEQAVRLLLQVIKTQGLYLSDNAEYYRSEPYNEFRFIERQIFYHSNL